MPSIINSDDGVSSGTAGLKTSGSNDGITVFQQNGTESARITAAGNVGIGTSSPAVKLEVYDASSAVARVTAGTEIFEIRNTGSEVRLAVVSADPMTFRTSNVEAMRIDSSGNVGIGTSSPGTRVHASIASGTAYTTSSTGNVLTVANTTASGYAGIAFNTEPSAGNAGIAAINSFAPASGDSVLTFSTRSSSTLAERARIDSSGNLLVGTTSGYGGRIAVLGASGSTGGVFRVSTNGDYGVAFQNSSGTTVGNVTVNSASTAYNTSSDYRLKHDIAPMTGALAKVAALKPVTYKWNADNSAGEGFIAHELAEVVPQCVTGEKDATRMEQYEISPAVPATYDEEGNELTPAVPAVMGEREVPVYQGIDTSFLVATLTAAIQELKAELDATKAEVAALKARTT